jgi:DNA-binding transcriptional LysR family regulator
MPVLAAYREKWSGIMLDLVGEVRAANLHRHDADLAIRLRRPEDPGLVVRRLGTLGYALYGTPQWLNVPPKERTYLGYGETLQTGPHQEWLTQYAGDASYAIVANDLGMLYQACRAGLGVTVLPHFMVGDDQNVVVLDTADGTMRRELWLVVHPDVRRSPRVQRVADLIAELVREHGDLLG